MEPATAFDLENGMRFIVAENHASPVCAVAFCVAAGVCEEPDHRRGIAHVVEHMMFRGSENVPPQQHAQRIARLGGDSNAFTSPDVTVYHEKLPAHGLEEAFRLEADRFQRIRFTDESLEIERKVILEELHVFENQPQMRAFRRLVEMVGGKHPYALDPLGKREHVEALDLHDLNAFHRRLYRPSNVFGLVCGDVERSFVEALAARHFAAWEDPAAAGASNGAEPFEPRVGSLAVRLPFEVPLMVRAHRVPPPSELDVPAFNLLVALTAGNESSPVRETLVKERRLCVEAGAESLKLRRGGILAYYAAFLPPADHAPRRKALKELCDAFAENGPDESAFAQHLKRFRKHRAHDAYAPDKHMLGLGEAQFLQGDYRRYDEGLADLERVTPERVRALARRIFAPGNTLELDLTPEHTKWWMYPLGLLTRFLPR
jgi:zinc protease